MLCCAVIEISESNHCSTGHGHMSGQNRSMTCRCCTSCMRRVRNNASVSAAQPQGARLYHVAAFMEAVLIRSHRTPRLSAGHPAARRALCSVRCATCAHGLCGRAAATGGLCERSPPQTARGAATPQTVWRWRSGSACTRMLSRGPCSAGPCRLVLTRAYRVGPLRRART